MSSDACVFQLGNSHWPDPPPGLCQPRKPRARERRKLAASTATISSAMTAAHFVIHSDNDALPQPTAASASVSRATRKEPLAGARAMVDGWKRAAALRSLKARQLLRQQRVTERRQQQHVDSGPEATFAQAQRHRTPSWDSSSSDGSGDRLATCTWPPNVAAECPTQ